MRIVDSPLLIPYGIAEVRVSSMVASMLTAREFENPHGDSPALISLTLSLATAYPPHPTNGFLIKSTVLD
jgi:hypothetical protein